MSRLTLKQQLQQLEDDDKPRTFDTEEAYTSLDSLKIPSREGDEGREHYLDVGPSRLRAARDEAGGGTLLGDKYAGKTTGRMKIFDDDDEDEGEEDDIGGDDDEEDEEGDEDEDEEDEDEDEEDEDEDEEDDEADEEEEEEEEDEDDEDEEEEPTPGPSKTPRALDPVSTLREARQKDIEKGRGIRRQKALFDTIITLRITFQKALVAATALQQTLPSDPSGELEKQRLQAIRGLADLSDKLLELRRLIVLPGAEVPELGKRKREGDVDDKYLLAAGKDSLVIADAQHEALVSILNKWSSKINAASLAVNSKAAGSSKFLASTKGQASVVEAIQVGLNSKKEAGKTLLETEESGYRSLLKEVIEARSGGSGGADLTHLRREKKKKREAERGGSKGRKLRYTVHDKAANFVVPIPLRNGWHDDQMDELFGSLLGGAGMQGASAETAVTIGGPVDAEEGLASLGGLRVF